MIEINLLPRKPGQDQTSSLRQLHRMPLPWIVVGLMVGYVFVLFGWVTWQGRVAATLKDRVAVLQPQQVKVQALQQVVEQLRAQESAFQGLGSGIVRWSDRLSVLAQAAPSTVWYTELILDPLEGVVLQGAAIEQGGKEMAHLRKLNNALSKAPGYGETFGGIRIDSIQRTKDKEIAIIEFVLRGGKAEMGEF